MATSYHQLSDFDEDSIPRTASRMTFGIVVSEWNRNITDKLMDGAVAALTEREVQRENIHIWHVPGSFELTFAAKTVAEQMNVDAVIALGCVIRGETSHYEYVCSSVTRGITDLNLKYDIPFIFGLLTTETVEQAEERAGGKYGNKGSECAITAIKMAHFNLLLRD